MNEKAKQAAVIVFGIIVIGGVIALQIWRARPAPPITTAEAPVETGTPGPVPPPIAAQPPVAGATIAAPVLTGAPGETVEAVSVPQGTWGRNPFLSLAEIAAMQSQPNLIIPVLTPLIETPPEAAPLPSYRVSVIMSGENGNWAVVDSRVVRPGDRLGTETITTITDRGIILEINGQVREILIERPFGLAPRPPQGSQR